MRYNDASTTVGLTESILIAADTGQAPYKASKTVFHNPHNTAIIMLGLAGETVSVTLNKGLKLKPGDTLIFEDSDTPDNAITGISDTIATPITIYKF